MVILLIFAIFLALIWVLSNQERLIFKIKFDVVMYQKAKPKLFFVQTIDFIFAERWLFEPLSEKGRCQASDRVRHNLG